MSSDYHQKIARDILGADLNQSLHHLIGYWYAVETQSIFDTELAMAMIEVCLKELENPVGLDQEKIGRLEKEKLVLKEALSWYANPYNCLPDRSAFIVSHKQKVNDKAWLALQRVSETEEEELWP
jgi:hypothetical protein